MANNAPKRIKVVIYPNQLEWIDRISKALNQPRRQTFLECFNEYIGAFKQDSLRSNQRQEASR
ncbi:MAG: hypothetical protein LUQ65_01610 [Candidatus Helarchaeota archaeon]|nr:hypothetical protein [Candidatus Helarchaeota archaeon]